jgi:hypothetical protein
MFDTLTLSHKTGHPSPVPQKARDAQNAPAGEGAMEEVIGQTISHYRILKKLGDGGKDVVFKAHDPKLIRHQDLP